MAQHLHDAFLADVTVRLDGLEPANATGHRVETQEIQPGLVYEDENVRVFAFLVAHGSWPQAFGYRFETPDRTIVVSGDTAPTDAIVDQCKGCDILVHEVYAQAGWERRAPVWKEYHAASHTSGPALGDIAARAKPKLLVLTHQLFWSATPDQILAEVRAAFDGHVVYGEDLDIF
jgi:ribonuclease Z